MIPPGSPQMKARRTFQQLIKRHEAYEGQICISTKTFKRKVMNPILELITALEEKQ